MKLDVVTLFFGLDKVGRDTVEKKSDVLDKNYLEGNGTFHSRMGVISLMVNERLAR